MEQLLSYSTSESEEESSLSIPLNITPKNTELVTLEENICQNKALSTLTNTEDDTDIMKCSLSLREKQKQFYVSKKRKVEVHKYSFPVLEFEKDLISRFKNILNPPTTPIARVDGSFSSLSDLSQYSLRYPSHKEVVFTDHKNSVNIVRWSRHYGHLLASGSTDHTIKIWEVVQHKQCVRNFSFEGGVRDLTWSSDNAQILSGGYDGKAHLCDVEQGKVVHSFDHTSYVTAVRFHPLQPHLFLSGCSKGGVYYWDSRTSSQYVKHYIGFLGQVLALEFFPHGKSFVTSSDFVQRNAASKAIVVWDVETGAVLSNQIYQEAFSCTAIRFHPNKPFFIAQSNGNYMAIFSSKEPYKINRYKRFGGHTVSGHPIQCDISSDGKWVVSGSSEGGIYYYDWKTGQLKAVIKNGHIGPSLDIAFHPGFSPTWSKKKVSNAEAMEWGRNKVASGGKDGKVILWK